MLVKQDTKKKKVWVSDVINCEQSQWDYRNFIIIDAGTGSGKSHFIRNELYEQAREENERILIITNRDLLKEQVQIHIEGKTDTITVINYQAIESAVITTGKFNFDTFKYVVCDECHYFLSDARFNKNNDYSLNAILGADHSIVVFMSATGDSFFRFLKEEYGKQHKIYRYYVPRNYSRIARMAFFNQDETLERFLAEKVKEDEKVLYFCNNVKKIYNLKNNHKDSLFIFSDPFKVVDGELVKKSTEKGKNDTYANHLEREAIKEIIKTSKLNRQYTFTTTTLDNGVDFKDEDLRWIVIDGIRDFDTIVQCIGRKRFMEDNPDDKIYVIIRNVNNNVLGGMKTKLGKTFKEVDTFINDGTDAWIKVASRYANSDYCIYDTPTTEKYDSRKKVNRAKFMKVKSDFHILGDILREDWEIRELDELNGHEPQKIAFIRYIFKLLDYKKHWYMLENREKTNDLNDYLELIVGNTMLTPKDRKELIEKMDVRGQRKLLKGLNSLNSYLEEGKFDYRIKEFETSRTVDGKKKKYQSAWKLMRLTED